MNNLQILILMTLLFMVIFSIITFFILYMHDFDSESSFSCIYPSNYYIQTNSGPTKPRSNSTRPTSSVNMSPTSFPNSSPTLIPTSSPTLAPSTPVSSEFPFLHSESSKRSLSPVSMIADDIATAPSTTPPVPTSQLSHSTFSDNFYNVPPSNKPIKLQKPFVRTNDNHTEKVNCSEYSTCTTMQDSVLLNDPLWDDGSCVVNTYVKPVVT